MLGLEALDQSIDLCNRKLSAEFDSFDQGLSAKVLAAFVPCTFLRVASA